MPKILDDWTFIDTFVQAPPATPAVDPDWLGSGAPPPAPPANRVFTSPKLNDIAATSKNQNLHLLFLPYTDAGGDTLYDNIRNIAQQIDIELLTLIPDNKGVERVCHGNHQVGFFAGWPNYIGFDLNDLNTVNGVKLLPRIVGWGVAQATVVRMDFFYRFQ